MEIKLSFWFFVFSFDHNFQQIAPNEECDLTFNIYVWKDFQLLEIRSKSNHLKVHNYLLVDVFVIIMFEINLFIKMYHILNLYKTFWNKMILKNEFESPCKFENTFHDFISKVQIIIFLMYMYWILSLHVHILIQVDNLNW